MKYGLTLYELMDFFCEGPHEGFSAEEIQRAEEEMGVSLPQVYRDFLRNYGKDEVNSFYNELKVPGQIFTSYEAIAEELEEGGYPEAEHCEAASEHIDPSKTDDIYHLLWRLPEERWGEITENYLLIWHENQGVWEAGYRMQDLLSGNPDPPVYMSTEDDFITFQKCAANTEEFLTVMLYEAAYGWHGGTRVTGRLEAASAMANAQVNPRISPAQLRETGRILPNGALLGTCLDEEQGKLYFYWTNGDAYEFLSANRKPANRTQSGAGYAPVEPQPYRPSETGPYRPALMFWQQKDLGMARPRPAEGVALHPLIALLVQNTFHHEPATAYDWERDLSKMKAMKMELTYRVAHHLDGQSVYIYPPGEHFPPDPFYFDLDDWSIIRRMTNLRTLLIDRILIEDPSFWAALGALPNLRTLRVENTQVLDFSFLPACKSLRVLSLYHTNFSDCRLLSGLQQLTELDLRFCPLLHAEALPPCPHQELCP